MPVILGSIFSAVIIFITVRSMIKVLSIAFYRNEISILKYRVLATTFTVGGIFVASILPFAYERILDLIYL
ncbi:hypothetical protein [Alteribacter aurantiacus]|uniref:hypothetical protein n=1 Tax=Alteribacter aurantiacus TaxID=254410 RepID=UPI000420AA7C|nr:hypothetical protein [Alteribacter aurantiacus]